MKDLGYVCLRCRIKLLATSTAARASRQTPAFTQNPHPSSNHDRIHAQTRAFSSLPRDSPMHGEKRRDSRPNHSATTPRETTSSFRPEHASSLAIFKSIVQESPQKYGKQLPAIEPGQAHYKLMKDAAKLHELVRLEMARRGVRSMKTPFIFFKETIYPQLVEGGEELSQVLKDAICGKDFTKPLFEDKARHPESADLPTATELTKLTLELGILKPALWGTLIIELLQHISASSTLPSDYTSIEDYLNAMGARDSLIHDVLGAWEVFSSGQTAIDIELLQKMDPTEAKDAQNSEPVEDTRPQTTAKRIRSGSNYQSVFHHMHSHHVGATFSSMLRPSIAAIATYHLLQDPVNNKRAMVESARPFFKMMNRLLSKTTLPTFKAIQPILEPYPDLARYLNWRFSKNGPNGRPLAKRPKPTSTSQTRPGGSETIQRLVGQAIRGRNMKALQKAWAQFWGESDVPDQNQVQELKRYPLTFDYFILAYMGMRRPNLAIDVWNRMVQIGIQPTIKTWNSMIQGCANAKNPDGIKTVWQKLVTSGTQLDTAVWTARIHGLIISGEPEAGLRALQEMANVWGKRKEPTNAAIAVQPTIEPVNAALAGLLRLERGQTARSLLAWAAQQGIDPDIFTFNTLLRPLVRQGQADKVDEIFEMMKASGVRADAATFTILFDGALANLTTRTPEKQIELVNQILNQMKATGIEVNMQTYAKMIYIFLQEGGDASGEPVKAVLAHIWGSGLELTSHIYTMLAEHYFSRDPPDSAAVTALIESRSLHANRDIDRVFWERVIKGYCQVGETRRALDIFDKVFASGTTITFSTLYDFLLALIESGDMEAAARLVVAARDTKEADGELGGGRGSDNSPGSRTRFWKHRFWHLVDQYGLMDEKLVRPFLAAQTKGGE